MNKIKQLSFEGQTIFCGIDVHKKSSPTIVVIPGKQLKGDSIGQKWQNKFYFPHCAIRQLSSPTALY
jgi:hypothetical protein